MRKHWSNRTYGVLCALWAVNALGSSGWAADEPENAARLNGAANPGLMDCVAKTLPLTAPSPLRIQNEHFDLSVSRQTGLITQIVSNSPTPVPLTAPDASPFVVYLDDLWTDDIALLSSGISVTSAGNRGAKMIEARVKEGRPSAEWALPRRCGLSGSVERAPLARRAAASVGAIAAEAEILYRLDADGLEISVKIQPREVVDHPTRVGLMMKLNQADWPEQLWGWGAVPSAQAGTSQFSFGRDFVNLVDVGSPVYPMMMLGRDDRILVYGETDLGKYLVLAPNLYPGWVPSVYVQPRRLEPGHPISLHLRMQVLPRPENEYPETLRWYGNHLWFTDKSGTVPVSLENWQPRTLPPGMIVVYLIFTYAPETTRSMEDRMLEFGMTTLWFAGWADWRERHPTEGEWENWSGQKITAEELKSEIARLRARGFRVHLYFRQTAWFTKSEIESPEEVSQPPYKRWMNRVVDLKQSAWSWWVPGGQAAGPAGAVGEIKTFWNSRIPAVDEEIMACEIDFTNPEARAWYTDRVRRCVETFDPDGVAWDYGWSPWNARGEAAYDPDSDLWKGFMWVQYEIAQWLREKYPDKRILQNYGEGAPSAIFADANLLEGGVESAPEREGFILNNRAFRRITSNYLDLYVDYAFEHISLEEVEKRTVRRALRGLGLGAPLGGNINCGLVDHPEGAYEFRIPAVDRLKEVCLFSALANSVPQLWDSHAVEPSAGVEASAWADSKNFLAACFVPGDSARDAVVRVSREALRERHISAGRTARDASILLIGSDGRPKAEGRAAGRVYSERGGIVIGATIGAGELLLVEVK